MSGTWTHITGAGDDGLVRDRACKLHRVIVGKAAAGQTLSIHDAATEAAAGAGNLVSQVTLDESRSLEFDVVLGRGLVAIVSGGAPDITIAWG